MTITLQYIYDCATFAVNCLCLRRKKYIEQMSTTSYVCAEYEDPAR